MSAVPWHVYPQVVLQPIIEGRDLIGRAKTGSGKTLAFALPVVENLLEVCVGVVHVPHIWCCDFVSEGRAHNPETLFDKVVLMQETTCCLMGTGSRLMCGFTGEVWLMITHFAFF